MPNDLNLNLNLFVVSSFCSFEDGDDDDEMTIYVKKTFDDLEIKEFKVSGHLTIQNIKWMVKNEWGIAVKHQRLKLKKYKHKKKHK